MNHGIIALFGVTLVAGLFSLFNALAIYLRVRDRVIRYFLVLFAGLSTQMVAHLALAYFFIVGGIASTPAFRVLLGLVDFTVFAMAFATVEATERLCGGPRAGNGVLAAFLASSLGFFASLFSYSIEPLAGIVRFNALAFTLAILPAAIAYAIARGLAYVKRVPSGEERSCLKATAAIAIAFFPYFLVSLLRPALSGTIAVGVNMFAAIPFAAFYLALSGVFAAFVNRKYFALLARANASPEGEPFPDDDFCRERGISPREREVISLMLEGNDNKSIARALGISANTVKVHASSVFRKLGVQSRFELVKIRSSSSRQSGGNPPDGLTTG